MQAAFSCVFILRACYHRTVLLTSFHNFAFITLQTSVDKIMTLELDFFTVFKLHQKEDGTFTCSGFKNGTTEHCRYGITKENGQRIDEILKQMSNQPLANVFRLLQDLARASLCDNHTIQASKRVRDWKQAIQLCQVERATGGDGPEVDMSSTPSSTIYTITRDGGDAIALQAKVLALEEQVKKLGDLVASLQIEGKKTPRLLRFGRSH